MVKGASAQPMESDRGLVAVLRLANGHGCDVTEL